MKVRIRDLVSGGQVRSRAIAIQRKAGRAVQLELLEPARTSILAWLEHRGGSIDAYVFPSRTDDTRHISTRQYARLVDECMTGIGLRPEDYGHALDAPDQGVDHVQGDRQFTRCADTRSHQDRGRLSARPAGGSGLGSLTDMNAPH